MKRYIAILTLFLIFSCGCKDDSYESYKLNSFESNIISKKTEEEVTFVNQSNETFKGVISAKSITNPNRYASDDESCAVLLEETHTNSITLTKTQDKFRISIAKNKSKTEFTISINRVDFSLNQCKQNLDTIPEPTDTYSSNGFTFKNIFIFDECGSGSKVSKIIYSVANGVEFIKYKNGEYLKRT